MTDTYFNKSAGIFKALAHPTRLKILHILEKEELCVCTIYEALDLEQSNVSQHLKVLRDKDILRTRREGPMIMYRISRPEILSMLGESESFLKGILNETFEELKGED
ncbi:MAG: winged helix-turn-helix transcriptional regulator [Peptostreptococcaceae bacterium]|nr:winged helix-turn-helix transcriptional regulator [Peptostreptococcaceae bacterium]